MKIFTSKTQKIGQIGEDLACIYLKKNRFRIIERNYTKKLGEIDIIAKKNDIIYFFEVKSVSCEKFSQETLNIRPEENITTKKLGRLVNTINTYLEEKNVSSETKYRLSLLMVFIDFNKKQGRVERIDDINI